MSASAAAFAFIAALIGAGFASGREIQLFFARFGPWGMAFALLCTLEIFALTEALLRASRRFQARSIPALCARVAPHGYAALCRTLLAILLCASAGAMLCAGGELFALLFPLHDAYAVGFLLTLLWGVLFTLHSLRALGWLGALLAPLMAALLFRLVRMEPLYRLSASPQPLAVSGLPAALCYAPLNLALSSGVICEAAQTLDARARRRAAIGFAASTGTLLLLGTIVLLRHQGQIQSAALPFVLLGARLGRLGYYACALMLYLAVLSTLTALLRTLWNLPASFDASAAYAFLPPHLRRFVTHQKQRAGRVFLTLACTLCAFMGFDRLIGTAYPVLGALCTLMLALVLIRSARYTSER